MDPHPKAEPAKPAPAVVAKKPPDLKTVLTDLAAKIRALGHAPTTADIQELLDLVDTAAYIVAAPESGPRPEHPIAAPPAPEHPIAPQPTPPKPPDLKPDLKPEPHRGGASEHDDRKPTRAKPKNGPKSATVKSPPAKAKAAPKAKLPAVKGKAYKWPKK